MGFGEKRRGGSGQVAVRGRRDFFLDQVSNISRGLWLGLYEVEALLRGVEVVLVGGSKSVTVLKRKPLVEA